VCAPVAPHVSAAPKLFCALLALYLLHVRVLRDHMPGQAASIGEQLFDSALVAPYCLLRPSPEITSQLSQS
jgi:hypothetical protein